MTSHAVLRHDSALRAPSWSVSRLLTRLLSRIAALDTLFRERARLADLDERTLRDIGVTRADVATALRRPDEHLRLVVLRRRHQFEN